MVCFNSKRCNWRKMRTGIRKAVRIVSIPKGAIGGLKRIASLEAPGKFQFQKVRLGEWFARLTMTEKQVSIPKGAIGGCSEITLTLKYSCFNSIRCDWGVTSLPNGFSPTVFQFQKVRLGDMMPSLQANPLMGFNSKRCDWGQHLQAEPAIYFQRFNSKRCDWGRFNPGLKKMAFTEFQFQKVRLGGVSIKNLPELICVSISKGAIGGLPKGILRALVQVFQFQKVRLGEGDRRCMCLDRRVSIPKGAIGGPSEDISEPDDMEFQFQKVRLGEYRNMEVTAVEICFNSKRCDWGVLRIFVIAINCLFQFQKVRLGVFAERPGMNWVLRFNSRRCDWGFRSFADTSIVKSGFNSKRCDWGNNDRLIVTASEDVSIPLRCDWGDRMRNLCK